jgi:antitoxin HicB
MANYQYPATIQANGEGGFIASFRDVPEAITEAWDLEELKTNARDALITAIDFYIEDGREFPSPSEFQTGDVAVDLPVSVTSKVLLLNTMVKLNVRPIDLARKMKIKPQEVTRITDIRHATKIDTIQNAFKALGKELVLELR